jgi:hypothetical protein
MIPPISWTNSQRIVTALGEQRIPVEDWVPFAVDRINTLGTLERLQVDYFKKETNYKRHEHY